MYPKDLDGSNLSSCTWFRCYVWTNQSPWVCFTIGGIEMTIPISNYIKVPVKGDGGSSNSTCFTILYHMQWIVITMSIASLILKYHSRKEDEGEWVLKAVSRHHGCRFVPYFIGFRVDSGL